MTYQYTYFIDRALGKSIGEALQEIGVKIEFHHAHFAPDAPIVSQRGWIVLTKDVNIGRNILEVQQIARYQAQAFVLVSGNLPRQTMINIFVETIDKIEKIVQGNQAPFIAKIYQDFQVKLWKNKNELTRMLETI